MRPVAIGPDFGYDAVFRYVILNLVFHIPMARKVVSRKEKRAEAEAAEKMDAEKGTKKKAPTKRKSRAKATKEVRLKAFWGVFNQSLKRIALYDYSQKKEAQAKAEELSASGKSPHFVQPVKEVIEDA